MRRGRGPAPAQAGATLLVHDLKNLAARLAALLQNLDRHYEDPLFKATALDVLDDTVGCLQRLAGDLRGREGHLLVKLKVDLNAVLAEALRSARRNLAAGIALEERLRDLPPIWGDALLLRQAFSCAVENALEAMGGQGTLTVRTASSRRGGRLHDLVEIADDGPGMSEAFVRERLFRPFGSTKEAGLGLGVYTMRQVAALHGGSLRILSIEGGGTRVRFHFPVEEA